MFLVVFLVFLFFIFYLWWWLKPKHQPPPSYPGALPFIGHAHMLIKDDLGVWDFENDLYKFCTNNGGICVIYLGPHPLYVITDPEDGFAVANTCLDKPYIYKFGKEMYNRGLVTADAMLWKTHRRLLNPAFNQQVLNTFTEDYCIQAKNLASLLSSKVNKGPFDLQPYLVIHLLKTACRTSLGIKANDDSELIKTYANANKELFALYFDRLKRVWLHLPFMFNLSSYKKTQDDLMDILKSITKSVIGKRKIELKTITNPDNEKIFESDKFRPLLDQMLDMADKQNAFTDDEIREHLDTILAANFDTTATALAFMFIMIGKHQNVQERIFKELKEVLGDVNRDLNRHDLPKLVYLEAVIKESLRLYPPTPRTGRTLSSNATIKLRNYTLPVNGTYIISLYGINRNHKIWGKDADEFRPERWLDPATLPANPNAFASYSLGRRNCIGKLYSMMSMKTTLAYIIRQYRITTEEDKLRIICDILIKPVTGHLMTFELRS